jgi:hypothetical protein
VVDSFSRPIQWYHSLVWPDGTYGTFKFYPPPHGLVKNFSQEGGHGGERDEWNFLLKKIYFFFFQTANRQDTCTSYAREESVPGASTVARTQF